MRPLKRRRRKKVNRLKPVYQCCYTNAMQDMGGKTVSGWQISAASADIPAPALDACARLQNADASLCTSAVDERGNVLTLNELVGDGSYLYVIRTRFGLTDRLGRPNMFSHALIFPLQDNRDVLWNPNFYLSLHPSSFLEEPGPFTWEVQPHYGYSISLEEAMTRAGLDREAYVVLVKCVYAQTSGAQDAGALYIQYDSDEQLRALLYCVYAGLPRYLVKTLRVALCPTANDGGKDLVFSRSARDRANRLIPRSGENTILTQRVERRIARYGFLDYAPRKLPLDEFPSFFEKLERIAVSFGDSSASNSLMLKLAFQCAAQRDISALTDAELESGLSDALRVPTSNDLAVSAWLSVILREIDKRGISLTEESEAMLADRLLHTAHKGLREAGEVHRRRKQ